MQNLTLLSKGKIKDTKRSLDGFILFGKSGSGKITQFSTQKEIQDIFANTTKKIFERAR